MKIDRVIFAWDGHPAYTGMWEMQCKIWPRFGIVPTLFIVGDTPCPPTPEGCEVRVLVPSTRVPKPTPPACNWQAALPLVFGPQFFPGEIVMTSGIDQVPLSRRFLDAAAEVPDDSFLVGFGGVMGYKKHAELFGCPYYPSSHMAASGDIWEKVLSDTPKDFTEFAEWVWNSGFRYMWENGWGLDEAAISHLLFRHQDVPVHLFSSEWYEDWDSRRVDAGRGGNGWAACDQDRLVSGYYSEAHLNHPPPPSEWDIVRQALSVLP